MCREDTIQMAYVCWTFLCMVSYIFALYSVDLFSLYTGHLMVLICFSKSVYTINGTLNCIKYARIRVFTDPYSRIFYVVELSNEDILQRCNTENIHQFITRQQRNFIARVIWGENNRMTKRLLFNEDIRKKNEYFVILYKTVLENEKITPDTFNKNALSQAF